MPQDACRLWTDVLVMCYQRDTTLPPLIEKDLPELAEWKWLMSPSAIRFTIMNILFEGGLQSQEDYWYFGWHAFHLVEAWLAQETHQAANIYASGQMQTSHIVMEGPIMAMIGRQLPYQKLMRPLRPELLMQLCLVMHVQV